MPIEQEDHMVEPKGTEAFTELVVEIKKIIAGMGGWEWFTLFGILFVFFLFLGSRASGWHKLYKHYPNLNGLHAEWIAMPDFFDRPEKGGLTLDFNNLQTDAINLGVDGQGMYLSMSMPFHFFHPPIFVPWRDVRSVAQGPPWTNKKSEIRFTFALCPNIPFDVDMYVAAEIQKRSEGRWTIPKDE